MALYAFIAPFHADLYDEFARNLSATGEEPITHLGSYNAAISHEDAAAYVVSQNARLPGLNVAGEVVGIDCTDMQGSHMNRFTQAIGSLGLQIIPDEDM